MRQTGHLVFATFPAANCVQSILRTRHFFPRERQQEVQLQLANCLRGIVSLRLLPRLDEIGVIPATEVLIGTDGIANMIRTGAVEQIPSAIQTGARYGMHSLGHLLDRLRKAGHIHADTVLARARANLGRACPPRALYSAKQPLDLSLQHWNHVVQGNDAGIINVAVLQLSPPSFE